MNKSGDASLNTVIVVVLLALGFVIVLFFYWQLGWSGIADKETCHQSVIYRASLAGVSGATEKAGEYIPLKCKTDKICVTSGFFGGKCDDFEGLKGITKVRVNSIDQIQKLMAQNIVDCWTMMGEGRVNLFSQWFAMTYGAGSVYPSCVICSRIAFDMESLNKTGIDEKELAKINIDEYMASHLVPNQQITYNELLSGDGPAKVAIRGDILNSSFIDARSDIVDLSASQDPNSNLALQSKEIAVLFMQISAPSHLTTVKNVGITALGVATSAFITAPKTTAKAGMQVGKLCLSGGWVGPAVCGGILVIAGIYQQSNIAYQRAKTAGYCGDVSTGDNARNGCSVVRTVGYNASEINQYCVAVESVA